MQERRQIVYYKRDGSVAKKVEFSPEQLSGIHGMMTRCRMKNGTVRIGFADSFCSHDWENVKCDFKIHEYINMWTWTNFDEERRCFVGDKRHQYDQTFEKVRIDDIVYVEAIMNSNPRWDVPITNSFFIDEGKNVRS